VAALKLTALGAARAAAMALSSAAACCQCPPFSQAMIPALQLIASHGWHGAEERQGQLPLHAFSQALMAALILSSIKAQCHWPVFSQALMATLRLTASGTARAAGVAPSNSKSKAHRHWLLAALLTSADGGIEAGHQMVHAVNVETSYTLCAWSQIL